MLSQTIREYLHTSPFVPFVMQMNDGRRFEVRHPDFAIVSPKGGSIVVFGDNDAAVHVNALLVASVEPLQPAAP
jgi:phosphatidylserine decarboxylase